MFWETRQTRQEEAIKSIECHFPKVSRCQRVSQQQAIAWVHKRRPSPDFSRQIRKTTHAAICSNLFSFSSLIQDKIPHLLSVVFPASSLSRYRCHRIPRQILHTAVEKKKAGGNDEQMRLLILTWFYCGTNCSIVTPPPHGGHMNTEATQRHRVEYQRNLVRCFTIPPSARMRHSRVSGIG